jgi:hypothetical protein
MHAAAAVIGAAVVAHSDKHNAVSELASSFSSFGVSCVSSSVHQQHPLKLHVASTATTAVTQSTSQMLSASSTSAAQFHATFKHARASSFELLSEHAALLRPTVQLMQVPQTAPCCCSHVLLLLL